MTSSTRSTTDYKQFSMLMDNRQTARTHINKLKVAIGKNPEILQVQPILVNEKMEIIDGQHRFVAASELGVPITYTKVNGLDISTAREMNVMQRKWEMMDYAYSYAKAGNVHYKAFLEYTKDYPGLAKTVIVTVMGGASDGGAVSVKFRNGLFTMRRSAEEVRWLLEQLSKIRITAGDNVPINRTFVSAYVQCIDNDRFDNDTFMANLERKPELFHRVSIARDGLRMIEDIHNLNKTEANRIRLY